MNATVCEDGWQGVAPAMAMADRACGCCDPECIRFGCKIARAEAQPQRQGCICPVGAEKTCQGPLCPRKPVGSAGSAHSGASGVGQGDAS